MAESEAERLTRIESNLAHLEHLYEQLNQVVVEQGKVIARQQALLQQISSSVQRDELERIKANNARPPHYQA